jgi:hypothetical protein
MASFLRGQQRSTCLKSQNEEQEEIELVQQHLFRQVLTCLLTLLDPNSSKFPNRNNFITPNMANCCQFLGQKEKNNSGRTFLISMVIK